MGFHNLKNDPRGHGHGHDQMDPSDGKSIYNGFQKATPENLQNAAMGIGQLTDSLKTDRGDFKALTEQLKGHYEGDASQAADSAMQPLLQLHDQSAELLSRSNSNMEDQHSSVHEARATVKEVPGEPDEPSGLASGADSVINGASHLVGAGDAHPFTGSYRDGMKKHTEANDHNVRVLQQYMNATSSSQNTMPTNYGKMVTHGAPEVAVSSGHHPGVGNVDQGSSDSGATSAASASAGTAAPSSAGAGSHVGSASPSSGPGGSYSSGGVTSSPSVGSGPGAGGSGGGASALPPAASSGGGLPSTGRIGGNIGGGGSFGGGATSGVGPTGGLGTSGAGSSFRPSAGGAGAGFGMDVPAGGAGVRGGGAFRTSKSPFGGLNAPVEEEEGAAKGRAGARLTDPKLKAGVPPEEEAAGKAGGKGAASRLGAGGKGLPAEEGAGSRASNAAGAKSGAGPAGTGAGGKKKDDDKEHEDKYGMKEEMDDPLIDGEKGYAVDPTTGHTITKPVIGE